MNLPSAHPLRRAAALSLLLTLAVAGSGCKKVIDEIKPKLPEATQDGKQTYGCMLDGKLWLPASDHTLLPPLDADLTSGGFTLTASDDHNDAPGWEEFTLTLNTTTFAPGTYTLNNGFAASYWSRGNDLSNMESFMAGSGNQGTLTITKVEPRTTTTTVLGNTVTSRFTVVSGTFEFTATGTGGKTITVKDGRFDVKAY
ncbi:hypothetical protein F0P96_03290 [Hymenobacter busanensis]|uniref:Uncharacterized protein n=1 Tax=Hymenobacter busanensis TaxID=2607656 RepID=A0A7L4ZUI5_9BACT|nr:hypothetical protein [Hymenobacter busanensis]KAA9339652.1 hypothetical protein F0P96_03290 [Hymenobacter busanensis]QHJ06593.1 hypothetical protein GUY19_04460 [Hymenobacter busanensis]